MAVLLNCHFPVVGFAAPPAEGDSGPLRFINGGGLAEVFRATGEYDVTNRAELEHPIGEEELAPLAPAEMEQVEYWRPARVGDVVFNFWD